MHITAGKYKLRKIKTLKSLRVTESRIKNVLYSLFKDLIKDKSVLDLFAGSGAVGIEALSWDAKEAFFVDINPKAVSLVKKNLSALGLLGSAQCFVKDAIRAVKEFRRKKTEFDFIFLDPPYNKGLLIKSLKTLEAYDIVKNSGFLVCLGSYKEPVQTELPCIFERRYGDRIVRVFTHPTTDNRAER